MNNLAITRRSFLGMAAMAPLAFAALPKSRRVPVGIELYSVRDQMDKDLFATVRAVAKMGYEVVEFYGPYYSWTPEYAKQVRKLIDDLGIRCHSTHNGSNVFTPESLPKAIELNQILGSKYVIMASAGRVSGADGWKGVAERLTMAAEKLAPSKMKTGFHNHKTEFLTTDGVMPMEILAANTPANVTLQLDVGTCVEAGKDPVAWIKANKGRITSIHCKEWGSKMGYQALLGEGEAPWKEIFAAAEAVGG
ncbi:MAG: sugar phosphate isomerase/epimerase family protein, partial [Acidobacteriota bacterium]